MRWLNPREIGGRRGGLPAGKKKYANTHFKKVWTDTSSSSYRQTEAAAVVLRATSLNDATTFAHALGDVLRVSEVRLIPGVGTYLARPEPIPPHTDHPAVRYIVWFCRESQALGGENVLLDGHKAVDQLSASQRLTLAKAFLRCPTLARRDLANRQVVWHERTRALFFAPWLPRGQEHEQTLSEFEKCLDAPTMQRHTVRLEPGDALVLDNHRMLHARQALDRNSLRWLTRYWIGEKDGSTAAPCWAAFGRSVRR